MGSMCGAFPTKRPRTSGSETHVGSENDAVSKNAVLNKHCVLCKNDALDSNDVGRNAATPLQPTYGRATVSPAKLSRLTCGSSGCPLNNGHAARSGRSVRRAVGGRR